MERNLIGVINKGLEKNKFIAVIKQILTPEEEKFFGDNSAEKITNIISYLGPFAPEPASIDKEAFEQTAGFELTQKARNIVFQFCLDTGLIKQNKTAGRFTIPGVLIDMLTNPNNGYLE